MNTIFILAMAVCFMAGMSEAIQCFTCQDRTANCVSGMVASCPSTAQFCKLEWTAATDLTIQTCASSSECPATSGKKKRQVGKSFVGADGSTVGDISNCCNYDGCNCVGSQCDSIGASSHNVAAVSLVLASIVFAALL